MPQPDKRSVLQVLTKARLRELVGAFELKLAAAESKDAHIELLARSKRATFPRLLELLMRDELKDLEPGQIVHVRSRQYLVNEVVPRRSPATPRSCASPASRTTPRAIPSRSCGSTSSTPACSAAPLGGVTSRGFDRPELFSAYLHTLRWSCVTATNPNLFQAPYRAGIEVKDYQLEPLRKALAMPRVRLFIADDVGLGKTIEAGLILREMLLRQRVRRVVVACPPSVVRQWQEEMEQRFGLTFVVLDRDYVAACRRERGYGVNPWTTHTRFIVSHALLRDETYAAPLRDWLAHEAARGATELAAQSLLILDEAHNAAPASGARYAVDSHFTRAVRELARASSTACSSRPRRTTATPTASPRCSRSSTRTASAAACPPDEQACSTRSWSAASRATCARSPPATSPSAASSRRSSTASPRTPPSWPLRLLQRYRDLREARLAQDAPAASAPPVCS
jgi:hypothetical protein